MSKNINNQKNSLQIFLEINDLIISEWKKILITIMVSFATGAIYLLYAPKEFISTTLIKSATVGETIKSKPIELESTAELIARLKYYDFYKEINKEMCVDNPLNNINMESVNNKSILKLMYKAHTEEDAKKCAEAIFKMIAKQQDDFSSYRIQQISNQLSFLEDQLLIANKKSAVLIEKNSYDNTDTLVVLLKLNLNQEINQIKKEIQDLKILKSPLYFKPTKLISPIEVESTLKIQRVFFILIKFIFLGLFFVFLILFSFRILFQKNKNNRT